MRSFVIKKINPDMLSECASVIRAGFCTVAADYNLTEQNCPTNGAFMTTERLLNDHRNGNKMYGL